MKKIFSFLFVLIALTAFSQNPKPFVVPEIREWNGGNGTFPVSAKTAIVANPQTQDVARTFAADYKTMFGKTLKVKQGSATEGSLVFTINPNILEEKGEEAYRIEIGKIVQVTANSPLGLYWATRTLLQMSEQSATLPYGTMNDYPDYPMRGFMLDVGRKYFSLNYLKSVVKLMSYYKMNTFQVHLNDNGFKQFFDDDWNKTYAAFRLESATFPGLAAKDGHYGKDEFRQFQVDALKQGVTIIPEIDAPAHTLAFTQFMPEIGSKKYGMDHLDLFNPKTYEFLDKLYDEYLGGNNPVFINKYVHIGTDEYSNKDTAVVEKFRYFTDYYIKKVESYGKKVALWGSLTHAKGNTPVKVKDVLMHYWSKDYAKPADMLTLGYDLLSVPDNYLYIVPATGYYYDYLDIQYLYQEWTPTVIGDEVFDEKHPQIKGGMFCVWNDHTGNGISYQDVHHRIFPATQTLAVKMWNGKNTTVAFTDFNAKRVLLSEAPGLNLLGRPAKAAKGVVFELKNPVQGKPLNQSLADIGYNYRVSFDITAHKNPNGTVLFSSDNATVYLTDPKEGKLGFSRDGYDYQFNYTLPVSEKVKISIEGTKSATALYVNDKLTETLNIVENKLDANRKGKRKWVQTLVFPLKQVGKFDGKISNLKVEFI